MDLEDEARIIIDELGAVTTTELRIRLEELGFHATNQDIIHALVNSLEGQYGFYNTSVVQGRRVFSIPPIDSSCHATSTSFRHNIEGPILAYLVSIGRPASTVELHEHANPTKMSPERIRRACHAMSRNQIVLQVTCPPEAHVNTSALCWEATRGAIEKASAEWYNAAIKIPWESLPPDVKPPSQED